VDVDYALFWQEKLDSGRVFINPNKFYFFKNEEGKYVGAVLDMEDDLHWFTCPKFRGKGYLSNALRRTILPHLFLFRNSQRITISRVSLSDKDFNSSEKLALRVGFEFKGEFEDQWGNTFESKNEYSIKFDEEKFGSFQLQINPISEDRLRELLRRIKRAANEINKIGSELNLAYLEGEELQDLAQQISKQTETVEDVWWSNR